MVDRRRVLLGLPALALGLSACSRIPDVVKIGVAHPMSGPLAVLGADTLNGVKLAIDELNAKVVVIDGKRVLLELVSADDEADVEAGKRAARQLIDANVVAVIGHLNSGVSIAAAPLYAERMIPQLALSTKTEYTQLGLPTTLRLVANDTMQAKAMGSFAADLDEVSKLAVIDDGTPFGLSLAQAAAAELGARKKNVVLVRSFDNKTTDFKALMPDLKTAGVDTIVTTLGDFQVMALIDQLAASEQSHMRLVGADPLKTDKPIGSALPIKAVFATSPIVDLRDFLEGPAFLSRFSAAFKGEPVYAAHYAYDATYVLVSAMRSARAVSGQKLIEALKRIDAWAPISNSMRFDQQGEQRYGQISVYAAMPGKWQMVVRSSTW